MSPVSLFLMDDGSQLEEWTELRGEQVILHHQVHPAAGQEPLENDAIDLMFDRRESWKAAADAWRRDQEEYAKPGGLRDRLVAGAAHAARTRTAPN